VEGLLNGAPGTYEVEFFRSGSADESGFGEGEDFLGTLTV
jgi:hypothetical protein